LISNDVTKALANQALWAALLTPQGKWLADFFVIATGDLLLLDVEAAQLAMLIQRLSRFRLSMARWRCAMPRRIGGCMPLGGKGRRLKG
jgi:folate-binding Fe-S cluster repair protein YgfZ